MSDTQTTTPVAPVATSTTQKQDVVTHANIQPAVAAKLATIEPKNDGLPAQSSADYYFDSYSHFGIHEEMLKDTVRTEAYRDSIIKNPALFKDKIVLDVGCGTAILSMFAAQAGAKHVIGVDCATIITQAREIVKENGLSDKITLIQGKVEEITLPDGIDKVDIIISEWMGYFLLYESMLDTVIYARDKWLKPGGLLFPDRATMYLSAIEDEEYRDSKLNFWDDVYGFKMSAIKNIALYEPLVDIVYPDQIISKECKIFTIDLYTCTAKDLDFTADFSLHMTKTDICHGFVGYFITDFSKSVVPISLSTSPRKTKTHWKQTIFYLETPVVTRKNEKIIGKIDVRRNARNPRDLDVTLTAKCECDDPVRSTQQSGLYKLH